MSEDHDETEARELDPEIHEEIERLCGLGDELAEEERYTEAIAEYDKALRLVPEPLTDWDASTWILGALADAFFFAGDFTSAREKLAQAMTCPEALGNPFLHLRFGQVSFELKALDKAADELMRAYMGAGEEIFEDEDPKYLAFLKTRAKL